MTWSNSIDTGLPAAQVLTLDITGLVWRCINQMLHLNGEKQDLWFNESQNFTLEAFGENITYWKYTDNKSFYQILLCDFWVS